MLSRLADNPTRLNRDRHIATCDWPDHTRQPEVAYSPSGRVKIELCQRLGQSPGRIQQMIAERNLYSILLEGRRYIPIFQFLEDGHRLVPNIGRVNAALDPELHPVEVFNWYTRPNPDLFVDDDIEKTVSPLDWLKAGLPVEAVVRLARQL